MASLKFMFLLSIGIYATLIHSALVRYNMEITWQKGAPNGRLRDMILINGRFPGPSLILNEGDDVEVTVHNRMPFNTTIHWHGIEQNGTPWSDGVPGLSQKPIESGEEFVYRWTANPYGTYWYHAHSRGTLQDGLYGSIYIQPKPGTPSPFHTITNDTKALQAIQKAEAKPNLLLLSDWDQLTSWQYMEAQKKTGIDFFCVDSILINGKGNVYCPGQKELIRLTSPYMVEAFNGSTVTDKGCFPNIESTQGHFHFNDSLFPPGVESGCIPSNGSTEVFEVDAANQWASINFISATSLKTMTVSIDEHPLWVYAVDGRYIEPQLAETITMYNGERYSAMVKLDKTPKKYTIRIADTGLDQIISGFATLSYKGGNAKEPSKAYVDYGGTNTAANVVPLDLTRLRPFPNIPPSKTADAMYLMQLGRQNFAWEWTLNGKEIYQMDRSASKPLLYNLESADAQNSSLTIRTRNGTWIDLVLQVGANPEQPIEFAHAMHKHSNKAYNIGGAAGIFNWSSVDEAIKAVPDAFNLKNPRYRDTFITGATGPAWMVVRYQVVVPGAFLFHCHIETHLEGGMAVALLDGVDRWPTIPNEYKSTPKGYGK